MIDQPQFAVPRRRSGLKAKMEQLHNSSVNWLACSQVLIKNVHFTCMCMYGCTYHAHRSGSVQAAVAMNPSWERHSCPVRISPILMAAVSEFLCSFIRPSQQTALGRAPHFLVKSSRPTVCVLLCLMMYAGFMHRWSLAITPCLCVPPQTHLLLTPPRRKPCIVNHTSNTRGTKRVSIHFLCLSSAEPIQLFSLTFLIRNELDFAQKGFWRRWQIFTLPHLE